MGPDWHRYERHRRSDLQQVSSLHDSGSYSSIVLTRDSTSPSDFYEIMDMLDKRLNDKGKNWRHVLKSLKVLDYCLHEGSELVVTWARENVYIIKTLREFQYIDEEGRDVGQNGEHHPTQFQVSLLTRIQFESLQRSSHPLFWTKIGSGANDQIGSSGGLGSAA